MLSHSTLTNTAENGYEDSHHQTLDNNYEVPERRDIDHTKSNVPLVEQRYGSLLDTHVRVYSSVLTNTIMLIKDTLIFLPPMLGTLRVEYIRAYPGRLYNVNNRRNKFYVMFLY